MKTKMSKTPLRPPAVAEKISSLTTVRFFEEKRAKADRKEFGRILKRKGGEPPRLGDELPDKSAGVARFAK